MGLISEIPYVDRQFRERVAHAYMQMEIAPFSPRRGTSKAESLSRDAAGLPARKGQMIWVEKLGFMREDDLAASQCTFGSFRPPPSPLMFLLS